MFKFENFKDWKTTAAAIIGGVLFIAGKFWPETVTPEVEESIELATGEIISGLGVLIPVLVAIFGAKDGDK